MFSGAARPQELLTHPWGGHSEECSKPTLKAHPVSLQTAHAATPVAAPSAEFLADGTDRRRQRRARANWPSRLIDSAGIVNTGRVCDVSEGGFGLMSRVNMPVGSLMEVALAVPRLDDAARSVPLCCTVRVISCGFAGEQSRLGVQFLALPMESRLAIRRYVLSHS